jgi:hypothetical protein
MKWPRASWLDLTLATFFVESQPNEYWAGEDCAPDIVQLLKSKSLEEICRALLTIVGITLRDMAYLREWSKSELEAILELIEGHLSNDNPAVWDSAAWAWARIRTTWFENPIPKPHLLDVLLSRWLIDQTSENLAYAFSTSLDVSRAAWKPRLTEDQKAIVRRAIEDGRSDEHGEFQKRFTSLFIGFYSQAVWPEQSLIQLLEDTRRAQQHVYTDELTRMLNRLRRGRGV